MTKVDASINAGDVYRRKDGKWADHLIFVWGPCRAGIELRSYTDKQSGTGGGPRVWSKSWKVSLRVLRSEYVLVRKNYTGRVL